MLQMASTTAKIADRIYISLPGRSRGAYATCLRRGTQVGRAVLNLVVALI